MDAVMHARSRLHKFKGVDEMGNLVVELEPDEHMATAYRVAAETARINTGFTRSERAGHAEKLASRAGSGGNVRSGVSPDASTHCYERGGSTWKVCRNCGSAWHRNGWHWYAGKRSKAQPTCSIRFDNDARGEWMAAAEDSPLRSNA